jgi:hypothetical protein
VSTAPSAPAKRTTTITTLLEETPGLETVMASARKYVSFLNLLIDEDEDAVEYTLMPAPHRDGEEELEQPMPR